MNWQITPELISVFGSGIAAFFVTYTTVIWRVSSAKSAIEEKIVETEHSSELERSKLREDILKNKLDTFSTFIHKDSFDAAMKGLDARLIRLEAKLDKILEIKS